MFECTLEQGEIFRKIITAIQDLVTDGNLQVDGNCISLQGMDSSHVSLVNLILRKEGFKGYRADKDLTLGINFQSLGKILKCMGSKDRLSIRTEDNSDTALFIFESPNEKRLSNFELKLMDIDAEQLGIPETEYKAVVRISSSQFQRICRDLSAIGETVTISVTKEGVKFSVQGEIGSGDMTLKQSSDENVDENIKDTDSEKKEKDEDDNNNVMIELEEPIQQTFALRYLNSFTKATTLSKTVTLSLGPEVPLVVEYSMDNLGEIRYYLAPKIDDEE